MQDTPAVRDPEKSLAPYISGLSELDLHLGKEEKRAGYERLVHELGVDGSRLLPPAGAQPVLLMAEQPGCWLTARDLIRARLLDHLISSGRFDTQASGPYCLADDRFTAEGDKAVFLEFDLHGGLGPVRIVGAPFIRRHKRRTYASLQIEGFTLKRLRGILDTGRRLMTAGLKSREGLLDEVGRIRAEGLPKGLERLVPDAPLLLDGQGWDRLADQLEELDREAAVGFLQEALDELAEGIPWHDYWDRVNGRYLDVQIRRLGPTLNDLILSIDDPVQMARRMIELAGADPVSPISVAGIALRDRIYRIVHYDPQSEAFFIRRRGKSRIPIPWERVRELASTGEVASPSGVLEYLLLAAAGFYLLVDPEDGFHPFHMAACEIHERYTGAKYPWITFIDTGGPGPTPGSNSLSQAFHPRFDERSSASIDRFMNG